MSSLSSSSGMFLQVGQVLLNAYEVLIDELSSDDEVDSAPPRMRKSILRDRVDANNRLMHHYFHDDSVYGEHIFRRRFRMTKHLFHQIVDVVMQYSPYFQQRPDARGAAGFSSIQKCAVAVRQLAYGSVSDSWDEYFQMSERTSRESLDDFCRCIFNLYCHKYLHKLTYSDVQSLYMYHSNIHGFPGMLGSLDFLHWTWGSCPNAWKEQYTRGDKGYPSVILEVVASQDLWIWHANFGTAGSNNDINVLNMSPIFHGFYNGTAFQVNGTTYDYGYYLVDGIYPNFAVFVKTLTCPGDPKRMKFKTFQEKARKDGERAFGVLKKRWRILQHPAQPTTVDKLASIMYACIILHNMILEDDVKTICQYQPHENVPSTMSIPGGTPLASKKKGSTKPSETLRVA